VTSGLLPFFTFYGGKWRLAPKYPRPLHRELIEPFAGSAGYSLRHPAHDVMLLDLDPNICLTWDYLIHASERDILALPDVPAGWTVDDLRIPPEAAILIGWWLNKGSAHPKIRPSSFMLEHPEGGPYWGASIRARIASQLEAIRHWRIEQGSYEDIGNLEATWFIDPPYAKAGNRYRFGSRGIDYAKLALWCYERNGQVIVCEADAADWLPFHDLAEIDGTEGRQKKDRARTEVMWLGSSAPFPGVAPA
jgi:site-specific DNA-adenine methylase